jgi:mono/diheme cytochrome c family protein
MKNLTVSLLLGILAAMSGIAWSGDVARDTAWPVEDDCGGESCKAVVRGIFAFVDRRLHGLAGNGRSCADCHMPFDNFQLSPASAEARFQGLQARRQWFKYADDPLFRPVDADDFRTQGEHASDFRNLRENALIRITYPLTANMRLVDPATNAASTESFVDVWRMVPSVMNVKITGADGVNPWPRGPNASGGLQLDARITTLQEQAAAAFANHAQTQAPAAQQLLDDLAAFQNRLFSSPRLRAAADATRLGAPVVPDADPPLNGAEQQGKQVFARACAQCHGGLGQSTPQLPVVRYHDISSQCPRPVDAAVPARWQFTPCPARLARNARTYEIRLPDGTLQRRTSSDPGRALITGFVGGVPARDDWNKLDTPGLRGIARTAPYFHNNSADTLEAVMDHYMAFFKRVQALAPAGAPPPPVLSTDGVHVDRPPTAEEIAPLLAYLRRL